MLKLAALLTLTVLSAGWAVNTGPDSFTTSAAAVLVAVPAEFVARQRNWSPFIAVLLVTDSVAVVEPLYAPPSASCVHVLVRAGMRYHW